MLAFYAREVEGVKRDEIRAALTALVLTRPETALSFVAALEAEYAARTDAKDPVRARLRALIDANSSDEKTDE